LDKILEEFVDDSLSYKSHKRANGFFYKVLEECQQPRKRTVCANSKTVKTFFMNKQKAYR
jgi:hypothetical protein